MAWRPDYITTVHLEPGESQHEKPVIKINLRLCKVDYVHSHRIHAWFVGSGEFYETLV
jgi:hypothetical protein